ncbi:hypothetical protein HKI87_10g61110 [Chloropicon roscoffensis]|uniref:Uncharacterized protein n=2 Tax=Chloropicon roscoffensis TaxID=1461544 RepID=A0AAX4PF44_9CHLO
MSVEKGDMMATAKGAVPPTDDEISRVFKNRLRALRKKVRNVEEIEKKVKEGKSINDQQSSALQLKPVTLSLIEEVERLGKAVDEVSGKASDDGEKELEKAVKEAERWRRRCEKLEKEKKEHQQRARKEKPAAPPSASAAVAAAEAAVERLLKVFYFGRLFDTSTGNTLAHYERAAYLGYDSLLGEDGPGPQVAMTQKHLDGLSAFAYYLSSRPMNQLLSHKQALDQCVAIAKDFVVLGTDKGKRGMEVPLSDGTFCDLQAMLDRVSKTGFYNIVPSFQDFGAAAAVVNKHQQEPAAAGASEAPTQQQQEKQPAAIKEAATAKPQAAPLHQQTNQMNNPPALTEMDSNLVQPAPAGAHPQKKPQGSSKKGGRKWGRKERGPRGGAQPKHAPAAV